MLLDNKTVQVQLRSKKPRGEAIQIHRDEGRTPDGTTYDVASLSSPLAGDAHYVW